MDRAIRGNASPWRSGCVSDRRPGSSSFTGYENFRGIRETCRRLAAMAVLREHVSLEYGGRTEAFRKNGLARPKDYIDTYAIEDE